MLIPMSRSVYLIPGDSIHPDEKRKLLRRSSGLIQEYLDGLEGIEENVSNISVPLSYSEELYHLRMHIDMLRSKLKHMIETKENNDASYQREST